VNGKRPLINDGEVAFPESTYTEFFDCSKSTYKNSRDQLIIVGFIKLVYRGGSGPGDCARFKILCLPETPPKDRRWLEYPLKDWEHEIPKPKKQLIGVETQWKPGQCGRK
jgi:hypothetical protein